MQKRQPQVLVAGIVLAEIELEDVTETFDSLNRARADFTIVCQLLLGEILPLAQFVDFETEIGLVHIFLLVDYIPIIERYAKNTISTSRKGMNMV